MSTPSDAEHDDLGLTWASDNIFADLGLPDADELLLKSDLVIQIMNVVEARHLSHEAAALLCNLTPGALYDLFRGDFDAVSVNALLRMLNALDQNVSIVISPKRTDDAHAHTTVVPLTAAD